MSDIEPFEESKIEILFLQSFSFEKSTALIMQIDNF